VIILGSDSTLKLVDVRQAGQELQSFQYNLIYAASAISPDGYAAAGSSNWTVFIWKTLDGVMAVTRDRGGSNGQQFASIDSKGNVIGYHLNSD